MDRSTIGTYVLKELEERRCMAGRDHKITSVVCLFNELGEKNLNELLESCIDDQYPGESRDYFGATFQKTFRQTDVTKSGHIDMAIWHCIHASRDFWEILDEDVYSFIDSLNTAKA